MSLPAQKPVLSPAPEEYNQNWMDNLVTELENFIDRLNVIGPVSAKTVRITDLPTSSAGLPSGSLWNDSGTVKVA